MYSATPMCTYTFVRIHSSSEDGVSERTLNKDSAFTDVSQNLPRPSSKSFLSREVGNKSVIFSITSNYGISDDTKIKMGKK